MIYCKYQARPIHNHVICNWTLYKKSMSFGRQPTRLFMLHLVINCCNLRPKYLSFTIAVF